MTNLDIPVTTLDGRATTLGDLLQGRSALVVNVASKCGLTPQYTGLVRLQDTFAPRGFTVIGVPCNQFMGQEPGTADEIQEFCSVTYGVDFPLLEKADVNGDDRHPLYRALVGDGEDIKWNFEKFTVNAGGEVTARFAPQIEPESAEVVAAIEKNL
ncbi:glutathione peroxidase [Herbidospora galbida]|uniref:Glutathione peroxidase n=1 Tax=Herbidospora galbida TaxID=2575442 RepID=A0A4U3LSZ8_9ACTN|nr:glutathione peroxidase [Herbidospora galbida]TKK78892.1 glutathione peroxidase [Herbidospora galbida]